MLSYLYLLSIFLMPHSNSSLHLSYIALVDPLQNATMEQKNYTIFPPQPDHFPSPFNYLSAPCYFPTTKPLSLLSLSNYHFSSASTHTTLLFIQIFCHFPVTKFLSLLLLFYYSLPLSTENILIQLFTYIPTTKLLSLLSLSY